MKIEPKRPNYTVGICCEECDMPMSDCDCEEFGLRYPGWSRIDDEALDDPRHGQAKENNRKVTR